MGMSDAELMARYGMDAQKANEASRQFGATYKQNALTNAANTEQARAQAGGQEAQYGLANLTALSAAGATQQAQEQAALDAQYADWKRQTEYPSKQLEQMSGFITAMDKVLPQTSTVYRQNPSQAQKAAAAVTLGGKILSGLGIKSFDDLKNAAAKAGQSIKDFAKAIGVKESDLPQQVGQEGQPAIIGERGTGLEEPPLDADGGNYSPNDPDFYVPTVDEDSTIGYGEDQYSGAAKGGLVDLLHKMRSYK
jgi:hypothetical protein